MQQFDYQLFITDENGQQLAETPFFKYDDIKMGPTRTAAATDAINKMHMDARSAGQPYSICARTRETTHE